MANIKEYQTKFIDFLLENDVLSFGDFTLKSGRKAPYFFNLGKVNKSSEIKTLGEFYAQHIKEVFGDSFNVIFGPAYKAIPLAITTAIAAEALVKKPVMFSFDRKEAKTRGEGGILVGRQLTSGDKVIIVEDVVTAGTTLKNSIPLIREFNGVTLTGVVLAIDRGERGSSDTLSAVAELEQQLSTKIAPIVTIHEVMTYLRQKKNEQFSKYELQVGEYLKQYGAT